MNCNQTIICGEINKLAELRYTPAGVAVVEFSIRHQSKQINADTSRQVMCDISAIAFEQIAMLMIKLKIGARVKLTGFLTKKSHNNQQLILHVINVTQL
ncbi:MAG: primosomal replication protein N [Nitrosomonas sp.]|nr:primosomal replication protein N [Nitrosomonas sp.]